MALDVTELVDLTEIAEPLGIKCTVGMFAGLAEHVEAARLLERLRDALVATESDPALHRMRSVVLHGEQRHIAVTHETVQAAVRFMARARAGIAGLDETGEMLAMTVAGRHAVVTVVFALWRRPMSLVIGSVDHLAAASVAGR